MFRTVIKRTAFFVAGTAVVTSAGTTTNNGTPENSFKRYLPTFFNQENLSTVDSKSKEELTGWDRLYIMFTRDECGSLSKELNAILYSTYTTFFIGGLIGCISNTKQAHDDFLSKNQATQFANVFEARKQMQDKVFAAGLKGLFKYGSTLALFCGTILTFTISLMVYYEHTSIIHYGLSGGIVGSLTRWKTGPKGMLAGGIVGGTLGLMTGGLTKGMFYLTGTNLDSILSYQDEMMKSRQKRFTDAAKEMVDSKSEYSPLLKEHDKEYSKPTEDKNENEKVKSQTEEKNENTQQVISNSK